MFKTYSELKIGPYLLKIERKMTLARRWERFEFLNLKAPKLALNSKIFKTKQKLVKILKDLKEELKDW